MATLNICENRTSKAIVFIPFVKARDSAGGSIASGKMLHLSREEFLATGPQLIGKLLKEYWSHDPNTPSELYNELGDDERQRFLSDHKLLALFFRERKNQLAIFDMVTGCELTVGDNPSEGRILLELIIHSFSLVP